MYFKGRRNRIRILGILLISITTGFLFQNCSGGVKSQSADASSSSSNNSNAAPPTGPVSCSGTAPADIDSAPMACPTGFVGSRFTRVTHSCVGTEYVANAPITIDNCVPATTPPLTTAERQSLCRPFVDTSAPATVATTSSLQTLISGLGDGNTGLGNGDVTPANVTATIDPRILPGTGNTYGQNISTDINGEKRNPATISCSFVTQVSCEILVDDAATQLRKAIVMDAANANYGQDAVALANAMTDPTAKKNELNRIARLIFSNASSNGNPANTCAFPFAAPVTTKSKPFHVENIRVNTGANSGFRCVDATVRIRMSARTRAENDNASQTPAASVAADFNYMTVTINDGCWAENKIDTTNMGMMQTNANYGAAVAVNARWRAVVSSAESDPNITANTLVGSITVFDKNNNNAAHKLFIPGATGGGSTGDATTAVALNGDMLAASRINRLTNKGYVQLYNFNGTNWVAVGSPFTAASGVDKQRFGHALVFNGSTLIIGAPRWASLASGADPSGKIYFYSCNSTSGCSDTGNFVSNTQNLGAALGSSLSVSGIYLAAGAPYIEGISDNRAEGYVSIYDISGTPTLYKSFSVAAITNNVIDATITNPPGTNGRHFGQSVSLSGNKLLVGAPFLAVTTGGTTTAKNGGAYFFPDITAANGGTRVDYAGPADGAMLGSGVALNANGAFIGCPYCQANTGVVRYYKYNASNTITATITRSIFALDRIVRDGFGNAVAVTDSDLLVGASNRSYMSTSSVGSAYGYAAGAN